MTPGIASSSISHAYLKTEGNKRQPTRKPKKPKADSQDTSDSIRQCPKRNEGFQDLDTCFAMDMSHVISPCQINLPPELTSLDFVGEDDSNAQILQTQKKECTHSYGNGLCTPPEWDIPYFQSLLDKVDKAIKADYKDNSNESVTLNLEDILETLEDCPLTYPVDLKIADFLLDEDSTVHVKSESECGKGGLCMIKQGVNEKSGDMCLLSSSEEQHLLCEVERAAWKAGRSLETYLDTVTEGISNCFQQNNNRGRKRLSRRVSKSKKRSKK